MSIAKVKLDESTKLEFGVAITGAESRPSARFVIEGKKFSVSYPCTPLNEGVEVEIGELDKIFEAGEYPVRLEIVIENKIYIPFEDTIILEPNVHITTQPKAVVDVKEQVQVSKVTVKSSPVVNREQLLAKQRRIAGLIAETLKYKTNDKQSPQNIINESLAATKYVTAEQDKLLKEMLRAARSEKISFDKRKIPPVKK